MIAFCVKRPVFITMATLILVLLGIASYRFLPIDLLPEVEFPTITIAVDYANASPEEMETLVARHIEEAVASTPGIREINTTNAEGTTNVGVRFNWGTDLGEASNDLRDRLDRVLRNLPDDADRPQLRKFDTSRVPVVMLGVFGDLDPLELRSIVDNQIQYRLEQVPGVAQVDTWGGFEREIQVNLDLEMVKALNIPLNTLLDAIRNANISVPTGSLEQGNFDITLRLPGEFTDLDQLRALVVAESNGALVRLGQVAEVADTNRRITRHVRIDGQRAVRVAVRKASGANTVEVARAAAAEAERLDQELDAVSVVVVVNQADYIESSIANTQRAVLAGGVLAVLVLVGFLRSVRSTLVIATSIPISIIATFLLMYSAGFTLNLMTLGGLALGVGIMVDNAIVVIENIFRVRTEEGLGDDLDAAAIRGTTQVAAAITASTLTTLVIFLPMLFMEGVTGQYFGQLGLVIIFALLCSLGVALTLAPMLSAKWLRGGVRDANPAARALARFFGRIESLYKSILEEALRARALTIATVLLVLSGSVFIYPLLGTEFMPEADQGEVRVNMEMAPGTRLDLVDAKMREIESIVIPAVPEARTAIVSAGGSGWRAGESARGDIRLGLVPRTERERTSDEIAAELRGKLQEIPGTVVRTRTTNPLRILNFGSNEDDNVEVEIRGFEFDVLDALAAEVVEVLSGIAGITDARASREGGEPQQFLRVDRDRAADLGLSLAEVARAIETAVAGSRAGAFREQGDEHRIIVRMADAERLDLEEILDLTIANRRGEPVAFRNFTHVELGEGPDVIQRRNQQRVVFVSGNISGRDTGAVLSDVSSAIADIPAPLGYSLVLGGDYDEQRRSQRELLISLLFAILLVYMVLASLYESLLDPLIVMGSVPMASIGVVVMLYLTDTTMNVQSFIGCIMLAGIVVNNAVLIVDQANQLRGSLGAADAVREAGRRRLRPILMTTVTTVLGLTPLALGIGDGAEAQAPLARAVIGGLLSSTIITLVLIPVFYSLVHGRRSPRPAASPAPGTLGEPQQAR